MSNLCLWKDVLTAFQPPSINRIHAYTAIATSIPKMLWMSHVAPLLKRVKTAGDVVR